jgi:hypothetical protein
MIIFAYALGGHTFRMNMRYISRYTVLACADNPPPYALALLRVNRQINNEARLLPFPNNTFSGRHEGHLRDWLRWLSPEQRNQIKAVKFTRRGYIVESVRSADVSPSFWMNLPNVKWWGLEGLKRIEVELTLLGWGWVKDETMVEEAKEWVAARMKSEVERVHPGMQVVVWRAD